MTGDLDDLLFDGEDTTGSAAPSIPPRLRTIDDVKAERAAASSRDPDPAVLNHKVNAALASLQRNSKVVRPVNTDMTPPKPLDRDEAKARLDELKARLQGEREAKPKVERFHPSDQALSPEVRTEMGLALGEVAVHGRMFRKDPKDGHERDPDEVRELVANLCRSKGIDQVVTWVLESKGLNLSKLPPETKARLTSVLGLAEGFWSKKETSNGN